MTVLVTFELNIKPEYTAKFLPELVPLVPGTRSRPGNLRASIYRNADNPNRFIIVSEWARREDLDNYLQWRAEHSKDSWVVTRIFELLNSNTDAASPGSIDWVTSPSEMVLWSSEA